MASARSSHIGRRGRSLERLHPKSAEHSRLQSRKLTNVQRPVRVNAVPIECSPCPPISVGDAVRIFSWSADAWVDAEVMQVDEDSFLRVEYMVDKSWYGKSLRIDSNNLFVPKADASCFNPTDDSSDLSETPECDPCANLGLDIEMDGFKAGDLVSIDGLQQRPELNGLTGVVLPLTSELVAAGRVGVALVADELSVRPTRLRRIDRAQTLKQFFESEYQLGLGFESSVEYQKKMSTMQIIVYEHLNTGIMVWASALDLRGNHYEDFLVLFHYTGKVAFHNIVEFRKEYAEIWASLKNPEVADTEQLDTGFGEGVYASCKEPREWNSKEQILINNFCSIDEWTGRADFCIPLLVPSSLLRECRTMMFGRHKGWDIQEHFQSHIFESTFCKTCRGQRGKDVVNALQRHKIGLFERDVWVVEVTDETGAVKNAMASFEDTFKAQVRISEKVKGLKHEDTLECYNALATCLKARGRASEAISLFWKSLEGSEQALGKRHPVTLISYDNYAMCLKELGRALEAERWHRKALEEAEVVLGRGHLSILLRLYNNFAMCLDVQGKAKEAEPWFQKSLKGSEKALGKTHPETLISYNNFAECLRDQGKAHDAECWHRKALKAREELFGKKHPDTLQSYSNLAMSLEDQGIKLREAENMHRHVLEAREGTLGKKHPQTVQSYNNFAGCLFNQLKLREAELWFKKALEARKEICGNKHPDTLLSYMNFAECLSAQGKETQAGPWYQKALKGAEEVMGKDHPKTQRWRDKYKYYLAKQRG